MPPIRTTSRTSAPSSTPASTTHLQVPDLTTYRDTPTLTPSSSALSIDWPFSEDVENCLSVPTPYTGGLGAPIPVTPSGKITGSVNQVVNVGHGVRTSGFKTGGMSGRGGGRAPFGDITMGGGLNIPLSVPSLRLPVSGSDFGLGSQPVFGLNVPEIRCTDNTPWFDISNRSVCENRTLQIALHDEIIAFANYIQPCPLEREAHRLIVRQFDMIAGKSWRSAEVIMQGSAALGLLLPEGDIDASLVFRGRKNMRVKIALLQTLEHIFRIRGVAGSSEVGTAGHSGVPMLTLKTTPEYGSFHVNMRIDTHRSHELRVVPRVNSYFDSIPALRPLVLVVKSLVYCKEANSDLKGGLSTYAIVCMCISFLRLNPSRLALSAITSHHTENSLGLILLAFLEYYAESFPYETAVISVRTGRLMTKQQKLWYANDPNQQDLLSIECILDPGKDIGQSCTKVREIRALFRQAAGMLRSGDTGTSLLGLLIQVDQTSEINRKKIRDLVRSRNPHALVYADLPRLRSVRTRVLPTLEGSDWVHTNDRATTTYSRPPPRLSARHRYNPYARKEGTTAKTRGLRSNKLEEMLNRYGGMTLSNDEPMIL